VADAGKNVGAIFFDFLPAAPAVAKLAPMKLVIDKVQIHRQSRGKAGNKRKKRLSVRFTGGVELQHLRERPHSLDNLEPWKQAVYPPLPAASSEAMCRPAKAEHCGLAWPNQELVGS
jgi:hypothetical protein